MDDTSKQALIERYLDGTLSVQDGILFEQWLGTDAAFADDVARAVAMRHEFGAASEFRFAPGFATRVMARLQGQTSRTAPDMMTLLWRYFPSVAAPAGLATVVTMVANLAAAPAGTSFVPALLGLHGGSGLLLIGL